MERSPFVLQTNILYIVVTKREDTLTESGELTLEGTKLKPCNFFSEAVMPLGRDSSQHSSSMEVLIQ